MIANGRHETQSWFAYVQPTHIFSLLSGVTKAHIPGIRHTELDQSDSTRLAVTRVVLVSSEQGIQRFRLGR